MTQIDLNNVRAHFYQLPISRVMPLESLREMKTAAQLNLLLGWLWIVLGCVSGALMGLCFHREDWLGGYGSWARRLYRLGHISFLGLGLLNLMFFLTFRSFPAAKAFPVASAAFALGAVAMPLCCVIAAHQPGWKSIFAVPVLSLLTATGLTLWMLATL
jgi:hypothetical protein